jgi:2-amino-4-hydroxy-6-hydroxymethyldihydropteridine diphosphokinase
MDYVIGLGSNLGDRAACLTRARERVAGLGTLVARSSLFESAAVGGPAQGPYLNAALRLSSELAPAELVAALLEIERQLGRIRRERWGPRTLDLDLLWAPGLVVETEELCLPHPRLSERTFALRPLLEVAPEASDPRSGEPYERALGRLEGPELVRVADADSW